jgi:hypothetical protein
MSISQKDSPRATAAVAYRADFVRVVAHIGLDSRQAACLAEAISGRRFQACEPRDLAPALAQLAALAERVRAAHVPGNRPCDD